MLSGIIWYYSGVLDISPDSAIRGYGRTPLYVATPSGQSGFLVEVLIGQTLFWWNATFTETHMWQKKLNSKNSHSKKSGNFRFRQISFFFLRIFRFLFFFSRIFRFLPILFMALGFGQCCIRLE